MKTTFTAYFAQAARDGPLELISSNAVKPQPGNSPGQVGQRHQ